MAAVAGVMRCGAAVQALCVLDAAGADLPEALEAPAVLVAVGDALGGLSVWDAEIRRPVARRDAAHCCHYGVLRLALTDAGALLSQGRDGWIRCWTWQTLEAEDALVWAVETRSHGFCGLAVGAGALASATDEDAVLRLWDLPASGPPGASRSVTAPDEDGKLGLCMALALARREGGAAPLLLALFESGHLLSLDAGTLEWQQALSIRLFEDVPTAMDVVVASGGRVRGVACGADTTLAAFALDAAKGAARLKTGAALRASQATPQDRAGFADVRVSPNCRLVACAGWDGSVRLVDWHKMRLLGILRRHTTTVRALAFGPDSRELLSGGEDGHVVRWTLPAT